MSRSMVTTFAFGVVLPNEDNLPKFTYDIMEGLDELGVNPAVHIEVCNILDYMTGIFVYLTRTVTSGWDGYVGDIKITTPTGEEIVLLETELHKICEYLGLDMHDKPSWNIMTSYI